MKTGFINNCLGWESLIKKYSQNNNKRLTIREIENIYNEFMHDVNEKGREKIVQEYKKLYIKYINDYEEGIGLTSR